MTVPLRIGLLGAGRWGKIYIRSISAMPELSLVAVGSRNPETSALVPPGCRVLHDWHDVVAASDVDAVIVATPPHLHFVMVDAALKAGKPVLVEKPFTCDLAEAEQLVEHAQTRGICLMVEHTHLFSPAFRALQAALPTLGPIQSVAGRGHAEGPFREIPVLWDWGPHDVSMALALLGPPMTVRAARTETRAGYPNAETIAIDLHFGNGVKADLMVSNITAPKRRWMEVVCAGGKLIYDNLSSDKLVLQTSSGQKTRALPISSDQPLDVALREFRSNAGGSIAPHASKLALDIMRVLTRCASDIAAQA